ncbi:restriction endonuclease [Streptomyces sp. NPDC056982]|uniref:restriction endonuclease n=1 Tax=Streptomyces sp. NPDC056982 TaxID=3345986 RepID=UPI00362AA1E5
MTTSPPTRRPRTRRPQPRRPIRRPARRTRRALSRISWGWAAGIAVGGITLVKLYPWQSAAAVSVVAVAVLLHVVRPVRLGGVFARIDRLYARPRRALPQQRTLEAFQRMSPAQFEQAIAELALQHPSVASATVEGGADDRGMDVRVKLRNGTDVLIQCKRYRLGNNVSSEEVMKVNGTYREIHHCHQAAIVTTSDFTRSARDTSRMLQQRIRLVPGDALIAWANGGTPPWN